MRKFNIKSFYSKGLLVAFALLYSFLVTIGSTYSWVTSSNQIVNEFQGEMGLKAIIVEDYSEQKNWQPGTDLTKVVSVGNEGKSEGFARVSFEEIIVAMPASSVSEPYADPDETGVTPEYCATSGWSAWQDADDVFDSVVFKEGASTIASMPAGVTVKVSVSSAGLQRYRYAIYQELNSGQAYRRMSAQFSAQGGANTTLTITNPRYWGYMNAAPSSVEAAWGLKVNTTVNPTPPTTANMGYLIADSGKKITIDYSNVITTLTSVAADTGKWYYNAADGFFYYIGKLAPGDISATLMTGLSLDADADVSYSDLSLQLFVNMQALQVNAEALSTGWGLSTVGQLYTHLSSFC